MEFLVEETQTIFNNIVTPYEISIEHMESLFDMTHQLFNSFQNAFLDEKQECEINNAELRESLAQNTSLRRKDFDHMMQGIFADQEEKEGEVRSLLNSYLNEQKEMTRTLKDNLGKVREALARGEAERIKEFHAMLNEIFVRQDERKKEVIFRLKEFQKEQQEMAKRLKDLLAKGRELRIDDLKLLLKEFKKERKERIVRQKERREEVIGMLSTSVHKYGDTPRQPSRPTGKARD